MDKQKTAEEILDKWDVDKDKTEFKLAKNIIKILDKKGRAGCINKSWEGYCNGNGTEIGTDIERLIRQAKRILKIHKS